MFSPYIPDRTLASLCRNLAGLIEAGVPIFKAIGTTARNADHPRAKQALEEVRTELRRGSDFASALENNPRFPPLAAEMMGVAERTGHLPEVLRALADHYENLIRTRKRFYAAIAWPLIQLFAAILIIAGMIFVIGMIGTKIDGKPIDVLGIGLTGTSGALIWLVICFGAIAGVWLGIQFAASSLTGQKALDTFLLAIPIVGSCSRTFAISRFSWAMALTQQTGMGLDECCTVSLKASSNGAFIATIPRVTAMVRAGEELSVALAATSLFPETYLQTIDVADASGTIPETLHRISPELEADARRKLTILTIAAGVLITLFVLGIIVAMIFRLFFFYLGVLNSFMPTP